MKPFLERLSDSDLMIYDGGFGSWIQEIVNDSNIKTKIKSQFIKDDVIYKVGSKDYLLRLYGPK